MKLIIFLLNKIKLYIKYFHNYILNKDCNYNLNNINN